MGRAAGVLQAPSTVHLFSFRILPRIFRSTKGLGRNLALPRRFLRETVDNPGRKTLYCRQRFRTMELVNGASGNPFRVASCGWIPRPRWIPPWMEVVLWPNDRRRQRESVSARCKRVNGALRLGDGSLGRTGEIAREILCIARNTSWTNIVEFVVGNNFRVEKGAEKHERKRGINRVMEYILDSTRLGSIPRRIIPVIPTGNKMAASKITAVSSICDSNNGHLPGGGVKVVGTMVAGGSSRNGI